MEQEEIKVGMGCSLSSGSDCYPYEVIQVIDAAKKHVVVRSMEPGPNKKAWPDQEYDLKSNPHGDIHELELYHGKLREMSIGRTGRIVHAKWLSYSHFSLGCARYYQDPIF